MILLAVATHASGQPADSQSARAEQAARPNIILILADDLGYGELGCYGNDFNETPYLDRLAAEGMRFTNAYTAGTVCSPTRGSIVTGQYPARNGIMDFLGANDPRYLDPDRFVTINEMLKTAGYHTGLIGKWHLDTTFDRIPAGPDAHGFDEVIATETKYIADGDYFFPYDKIETVTSGSEGEFLTDRLAAEAVGYIERRHESGEPFFLYLSHYSVHTALEAPEELVRKYAQKHRDKHGEGSVNPFRRPRNRAHLGKPDNPYLAAMIERLDAGVGQIVDRIDELGIGENTVVIFISDNGGDGRVANNGVLRGSKTLVWEGGIRVPQIVRWPGSVEGGVVNDTPTTTVDFYPTFAALAGAELPADQALDGTDLSPVLAEAEGSLDRDAIFWHYPANTAPWPERAGAAVRVGNFKLIHHYDSGRIELYDLAEDPSETHDLAAERPDVTDRLRRRLDEWRQDVDAIVPEPREP